MKMKTKKSRNSVFPLHDAVAIPCSEKGFSLLQWDFSTKDKYPRYSYQFPNNAAQQILHWRNLHKLNIELGDYK
jgi:hypothetical protein